LRLGTLIAFQEVIPMRNMHAERASYDDLPDTHIRSTSSRAPMPSDSDLPTLRPSGVRRVSPSVLDLLEQVGDAEVSTRDTSGPIGEMEWRVPVIVAEDKITRDLVLDARARWLLPFIDGDTPLAIILENSGMPQADAVEAFCALLEHEVVALL